MQFDTMSFLTSFLVAQADNPDGDPARTALIASMIPGPPAMRLVMTTLLAGSPAAGGGNVRVPLPVVPVGPNRLSRSAPKPKVKVPHAGHLTDKGDIERHFRDHKLKARIIERSAPGLTSPMVVHQYPDRDEEVEEGSVIDVVYLTGSGKRS